MNDTEKTSTPNEVVGVCSLRYKNYRGETRPRSVLISGLWFGHSKYHPESQWFIRVVDMETSEFRDFALKDCDFLQDEGTDVRKSLLAEAQSQTSWSQQYLEELAEAGLWAAQQLAHRTARKAGWYSDPETGQPKERNFGEVVALMHSELSEALEADRKNLKDDKLPHRDGREVEFADCLIRILDTAEAKGMDIARAFIEKNRYNMGRLDHKLDERVKPGGKKY